MQSTSDPHCWNHQSFGLKPGDHAYLVDDVNGFGQIRSIIVGAPCEDGHGYEATFGGKDDIETIHTCNFYLATKMGTAKDYARKIVVKCLASAKAEQADLNRRIQYLIDMQKYLKHGS